MLFDDANVGDMLDWWWLELELKLDNVVLVEVGEDTVPEGSLPELELE